MRNEETIVEVIFQEIRLTIKDSKWRQCRRYRLQFVRNC